MSIRVSNAPRSWHVLAVAVTLAFLGLGITSQRPIPAQVAQPHRPQMVLATTVGLRDSGLLDLLLSYFKQGTGYEVQTLAIDSAQAFATGKEGKADALLVDSPPEEEAFVAKGYGVDRRPVMHTDYLIVGSPGDPARLAGKQPLQALQSIASTGSTWVSRRDGSDTNVRELELWQLALGRDAQHEGWYVSTHQGMRATLAEASRRRAYSFTDRATFLAEKGKLQLQVLVEKDPLLVVDYHIIRENPQRWPATNLEGARALADFLGSQAARDIIAGYGLAQYGQPLFTPDAQP